jgi:hypothetical protein
MLRGWQYGQHRLPLAIGVQTPSPAEYALAVLPQDLEVAFRISAEPKGFLQRPHSGITLVVAIGHRASLGFYRSSASAQAELQRQFCHSQRSMECLSGAFSSPQAQPD